VTQTHILLAIIAALVLADFVIAAEMARIRSGAPVMLFVGVM
jgi:hypothetical protein